MLQFQKPKGPLTFKRANKAGALSRPPSRGVPSHSRVTVRPRALPPADIVSPVLQNALKAWVFQTTKSLKGAFDLKREARALLILKFLQDPCPQYQEPLLAEDFTMTMHKPNWSSEPYHVLNKQEYLAFLGEVRASSRGFMFGSEPTCDGLRDDDGTVLVLTRPYGHHDGAPFQCPGGDVPPSSCSFLMALTELKFLVHDEKGVIKRIQVLAPPRRNPFMREGIAESLINAPLRSTLSYTSIDWN